MNKITFTFVIMLLSTSFLMAQNIPKGINYQAVARDIDGAIMKNKTINLKLSLVTEQPSNQVFYAETHRIETNQFGLFTLVVGNGEVLLGSFEKVPWSTENIMMETAMDTKGGDNFKVLSTSKLLAVPYAFHANTASTVANNYEPNNDILESLAADLCPTTTCECEGGYTEIELYYFGEDDVTVEVYSDYFLTDLIDTFNNVMSGNLLTIDGTVVAGGVFGKNTFLKVISTSGDECLTGIYTDCPKNVYPGSLEDLKILGKTYGNFTVFSHTDFGNNSECRLDVTGDRDWQVGGNIVDGSNNNLGTKNSEGLVFITKDLPRGIITADGDFGLGTTTPGSFLDVAGDANFQENVNLNGVTRVFNLSASNSPLDGALIVDGGTGISQNLNVGGDGGFGNNLTVGNDANVISDLSVGGNTALTQNLEVAGNTVVGQDLGVVGDSDFSNNITVGGNADLNNDLTVGNNATVGQDLVVGNNANVQNNLGVTDNALIGRDLEVVRDAKIGDDLIVEDNIDVGGNLDVVNSATIGNDLIVTDNFRVEDGGLVRIDDGSQSNNLTSGAIVVLGGGAVGKNFNVGANLTVAEETTTGCITIVGGCDFAENFDVNEKSNKIIPEAGLLVSIDPENPGELMISDKAYDKKLAGIISGANGISPGMVMSQENLEIATGAFPVALTGRVYVKTDASFGAIEPGDMLTSSNIPGVAMKVLDFTKAHGAVIGKAMTALEKGEGYVLVLVNLQ